MIIYGVALLAFCFLTGNYIGDILARFWVLKLMSAGLVLLCCC